MTISELERFNKMVPAGKYKVTKILGRLRVELEGGHVLVLPSAQYLEVSPGDFVTLEWKEVTWVSGGTER